MIARLIRTLIKTLVSILAISYFLYPLPLLTLLHSFGLIPDMYAQWHRPHGTKIAHYQDGIYAIRVFRPNLDRPRIAIAEKVVTERDDYAGHYIFVGPRHCYCDGFVCNADGHCGPKGLPTVHQGNHTPNLTDEQLEEMAALVGYPERFSSDFWLGP